MTSSGAIVCAVARGVDDIPKDVWIAQRNELMIVKKVFDDLPDNQRPDVEIVLLNLAEGGDAGLDQSGNPVFQGSLDFFADAPTPEFLKIVNSSQFQETQLSILSPAGSKPNRGWVPDEQEYLNLFDDRINPDDPSDSFIPKFGHPPALFFIAASRSIVNPLQIRPSEIARVRGLIALGLSNKTRKLVEPIDLNDPLFHQEQTYINDQLISAIRFVRANYGTLTEQSEFSPHGYVGDFDRSTGRPLAAIVYDTPYGALARMLRRAANQLL